MPHWNAASPAMGTNSTVTGWLSGNGRVMP